MALSDSLFLFEIFVEELKSYVNKKKFIVKSQFADVFSLVLRDSVVVGPTPLKKKKTKGRNKTKCKNTVDDVSSKVKMSQSVLFSSNIDVLMSYMMKYPMEISLWNERDPDDRIGSSVIPWDPVFVEFLARLYMSEDPPPVVVKDTHNVFDERSSKRMATIKLVIKMSYIKDAIPQRFKSVAEKNTNTLVYSCDLKKSKPSDTVIKPSNDETGIIKTFYRGGKREIKHSHTKKLVKRKESNIEIVDINEKEMNTYTKNLSKVDRSLLTLVRSDSDIDKKRHLNEIQTKSCTFIKPMNILNYGFNDQVRRFRSKVYTVGYVTIEQSKEKSISSSDASKKTGQSPGAQSDCENACKPSYEFQLCTEECPAQQETPYAKSRCSLDLPEEARELISVAKCKELKCVYRKERPLTNPRDDNRLLDLSSLKYPCCVTTVKEEVVGSMKAQIVGEDPCSCACECVFNIDRKTTYCQVCGGYEFAGEDIAGKPQFELPPPCPIYHRMEKKKPASTSGSESRKKSERDRKKEKKRKVDNRFKFNYGYKGIPPQIGHSQCALQCPLTGSNVPKKMGWLWTADDVPGLKFRPQWKPGAINKFVVRLLKQATNPGKVSKKRRKDTGKKRRPLKRPLLIIHKKEGEYHITMETMKPYAKQRAVNQAPFEDKEPLTYTVGRTDEENRERKKKKERAQRRLEREQRDFIESAFRDMCKDICLKTYQQALGILPTTEDPDCTCYPALPGPELTNLDRSCSCSEDNASLASDTDLDEWIVEFTPPNAYFDPNSNYRKVFKNDVQTQYTYLDYRVKLLDASGNQVPRFFKGLDGKELCSDLGGFWGPDHKWLEINIDGFIGPDGRWAPNMFFGPNGEHVDAEGGKFQAMNGDWLTIGVDGYVDSQNKWRFYSRYKARKPTNTRSQPTGGGKVVAVDKVEGPKSERSWGCFGDVSPEALSKLGITGHGPDKRLLYNAIKDLVASGRKDIKLPEQAPQKARSFKRGRRTPSHLDEQVRCRHAPPSDKGIVVDKTGHRTYFKLPDWKNKRPRERMDNLEHQGRSLSMFHKPCFHSFIDRGTIREQQMERLARMAAGLPAHSTGNSIAVQTVRM